VLQDAWTEKRLCQRLGAEFFMSGAGNVVFVSELTQAC